MLLIEASEKLRSSLVPALVAAGYLVEVAENCAGAAGLMQACAYAMVVLERSGVHLEVDARPSDALALAVRVGAPIFVAEHVLEHNALSDDLSGGTEGFEA